MSDMFMGAGLALVTLGVYLLAGAGWACVVCGAVLFVAGGLSGRR